MEINVSLYRGIFGQDDPETLVYAQLTVPGPGTIRLGSNFRARIVIGTGTLYVPFKKKISFGVIPSDPLEEDSRLQYYFLPLDVSLPSLNNRTSDFGHLELKDTPEHIKSLYYTFAAYRRMQILLLSNKGTKIRANILTWTDKQSNGAKSLLLDIITRLNDVTITEEIKFYMNLIKQQNLVLGTKLKFLGR